MSQAETFEAFVLDLDGTLIDSGKYHAQAFADAVSEQAGYRLTEGERHEFFAGHSTRFVPVLNERHGLSLDPARVLTRKRARVKEIFRAEPFSGAAEFLARWKGRVAMGLATNSPASFVLPALEAAGLREYFDAIVTSDEVEHRKPHPEIVERTVDKLGAKPEKTLTFEDQLIGIRAARAAGTGVVAVDNGQPVTFPPDIPVATWKTLLRMDETLGELEAWVRNC